MQQMPDHTVQEIQPIQAEPILRDQAIQTEHTLLEAPAVPPKEHTHLEAAILQAELIPLDAVIHLEVTHHVVVVHLAEVILLGQEEDQVVVTIEDDKNKHPFI